MGYKVEMQDMQYDNTARFNAGCVLLKGHGAMLWMDTVFMGAPSFVRATIDLQVSLWPLMMRLTDGVIAFMFWQQWPMSLGAVESQV